ncbi:hypothetical protein BC830DRAFT_1163555 [Chytriomyces sp. MP71]|nr:hypothetical protein BC830DRAFT_1163555 [Chytriomyces sp. MP71]
MAAACHRLKVVLLCKGHGGDPSGYKPELDETQWWARRDALVRCVAAFLCGPASAPSSTPSSSASPSSPLWRSGERDQRGLDRSLVLVHDEDAAIVHMKASNSWNQLHPSEGRIIQMWKDVLLPKAHALTQTHHLGNCVIEVPPNTAANKSDTVSKLDSKRTLLQHLHKHCDLEFLRSHSLNAKAEVVLKKTNKKDLVKIWIEWEKKIKKNAAKNANEQISVYNAETIERYFSKFIQPSQPGACVIAAYLHETVSSELPCFGFPSVDAAAAASSTSMPLEIILFLGAVRDMTPLEHTILQKVCASTSTPLTCLRLGPIAEFTSKILTIVAFHQAHGTLAPAIHRLLSSPANPTPRKRVQSTTTISTTDAPTQRLHILCALPIPSMSLTAARASQRSRTLWALVRLTVASLWRSHVARGTVASSAPLTVRLSLLFCDGRALSVSQEGLVKRMAGTHQAAPAEYQVLRALVAERDAREMPAVSWMQEGQKNGMDALVEDAGVLLDLDGIGDEEMDGAHMVPELYAMQEGVVGKKDARVTVLMKVRGDRDDAATEEVCDVVRTSCERKGVPVVKGRLMPEETVFQDVEAASVTMVQHFMYQDRLVAWLEKETELPKGRRGAYVGDVVCGEENPRTLEFSGDPTVSGKRKMEDELLVLAAIYGDGFSTDHLAATHSVRIVDGVALSFWADADEYPFAVSPAFRVLLDKHWRWRSRATEDELIARFEALFVVGEVVLFAWIEHLSEHMDEYLEQCDPSAGTQSGNPTETYLPLDARNIRIHTGAILTDRKSRFQAHIARVTSLQDVDWVVRQVKTFPRVADATHVMVAYRLASGDSNRDDDGEGGAGDKMLYLLEKMSRADMVGVVVRWYGGVPLGPDRFKDITGVLKQLIDDTPDI